MTNANTKRKYLITGATGMQGGAVARALASRGEQVTALVRNPDSGASRALTNKGIALVVGDLEDPSSLRAAAEGHDAVFSVQLALPDAKDAELRHARNLIAAAREAGVAQFVQTTVSSTGWRDRPDVARKPRDDDWYWDAKEDVEAAVRAAGFASYTIVKPAYFIENFTSPHHYTFQWPHLVSSGELVTACDPSTELALLHAPDLGNLVADVLTAAPDRFAGVEIELASDRRTFTEIAAALSDTLGRPVTARQARPDDNLHPLLLPGQIWWAEVGYSARPEDAEKHGLSMPTKLPELLNDHRDELAWIAGTADPA
ncbi:NmrA family NAD(P)-binding protein [Solirubrobacter taibaiensis]|nr:NmrA family NAD(P)-binding protein [Solirubrobacter taibaiensis]